MRALILVILILLEPSKLYGLEGVKNSVFEKDEEESLAYYHKLEPSGCYTRLLWYKNANRISISHDRQCEIESEKRESVREISNSVYEIMKYFDLGEKIKTIKEVAINIGWNVNNEPLLQYINNNEEWPDNIFEYSRNMATKEEDCLAVYTNFVRNEIIKSNIYNPFIEVMRKFDCIMTLKDNFVDGLLFDRGKRNLTKENLIKNGVFKEEEARKDVYPQLKGAIEFALEEKGDMG